MKILKSIIYCGVGILALSLSSCNDWLDVNVDPENPSAEGATYQSRLAHIEFYTNDANQFAAWRSSMAMGDWTRNFGGGTYSSMSGWLPTNTITTTPYQWWFVGAGANINDMYTKALAAGNYNYAAVAKVIRAYGFMLMTDLYGEMPYTDALGENAIPKYDTGKTIFMGCLADIDEAIDLFQKGQSQAASLPALSEGDYWNGGDAAKWVKLAYLLKARWINHLIKKGNGNYKDGKYDAATILDCLAKAQQSNADNTVINHTDANSKTHDDLGWDEPVDYSPLYSVMGMNSGYRPTKMLVDNLTNFGGYGVEDPRADHIIPWAYSKKTDASPAGLKWSGNWRRGVGVDMLSGIRNQGGPLNSSYNTTTGSWYINSTSPDRIGDTIYVEATSSSKGYDANKDLLYRKVTTAENSKESGTFYSRVSAPTYIGTYSEACFIKAEVLFRQNGATQAAFDAYKEGIKASIELMNVKLKAWVAEDASLADCPSFAPMAQADIDNFLTKGIGNAANLTLGKILTQKRIALMFSMEIWNDMRRYDFDTNIFLGWGIPSEYYQSASAQKAIPLGKQFRRWRQCSHEYNYNATNLQAIGAEVPGANMSSVNSTGVAQSWNLDDAVWSIPVWWDSDQQ